MINSLKHTIKVAEIQYLLEYSIGFGSTVKSILNTIHEYTGDQYKKTSLGILLDYGYNKLEGNTLITINDCTAKPPSFFLFYDLFLIDKNMKEMKYTDAFKIAKEVIDKLVFMNKELKVDCNDLAELFIILYNTLLLKLNKNKELIEKFKKDISSFPSCRELYRLYFEAILTEENFNIEAYLNEVQSKFPNWSWVVNTRAWVEYSKPSLTGEGLALSIKLLEDSIKTNPSLDNSARLYLGTILWVHKGKAYIKLFRHIKATIGYSI